MPQFDSDDAERRSHLKRAAGLRGLAAETNDVIQRDLLGLLADSYEDLAERVAQPPESKRDSVPRAPEAAQAGEPRARNR
jgi:hypothetical protein